MSRTYSQDEAVSHVMAAGAGEWTARRALKQAVIDGALPSPTAQTNPWHRGRTSWRYDAAAVDEWVGNLIADEFVNLRRPRGTCGTESGYQSHRRRGEDACRPCKDAAAAAVRARRQRRT